MLNQKLVLFKDKPAFAGRIMKTIDWTRDELIAYILLFAANSDFIEDSYEHKLIMSKVNEETYRKIHEEFEQDNDYQSIEKILTGLRKYNYTKEDIQKLLKDIEELFFADGDFNTNEYIFLNSLKRLFNTL